jgi:hypothetical protein
MPSHFSYIGEFDNSDSAKKFYWDNVPDEIYRTGNLPRRLIPNESHESLPVSAYFVMDLIRQKHYAGRQIDWSAWGLKMSAAGLVEFWRTYYAQCAEYEAVAQAIGALDQGKCYVLVVAEHA